MIYIVPGLWRDGYDRVPSRIKVWVWNGYIGLFVSCVSVEKEAILFYLQHFREGESGKMRKLL